MGRVVKNSSDGIQLAYPANLTFPLEAMDSGQRFALKASLMGIVAVDKFYMLKNIAIRGYTLCSDEWLADVYARFVVRAARGEFRLNPYAKPETIMLMQGDGEVEAETGDVTIISADPTPTTSESANA